MINNMMNNKTDSKSLTLNLRTPVPLREHEYEDATECALKSDINVAISRELMIVLTAEEIKHILINGYTLNRR